MSHLVSIKTQVRDPIAIQSACERLKLPAPVYGTARLFTSEATGWQIKLPEWLYPVVCDTDRGEGTLLDHAADIVGPLHLRGCSSPFDVMAGARQIGDQECAKGIVVFGQQNSDHRGPAQLIALLYARSP